MKVRAAAVQLHAAFGDARGNRAKLADAVRSLEGVAELIAAPELTNSGYDLEGLAKRGDELAESLDGPTVTLARELADEVDATLVVGILEARGEGAFSDTAVVTPPGGEPRAYRKTHLYPPEQAHFAAGDRLAPVPSPAGTLGLMICFEHAFPEIATTLALQGAQILVIPSAVPDGYEHLLTLRTRARGQDNQLFVIAANLAGGGFCGRSLITGPKGETLAEAGTGPATIRATLDLVDIDRERHQEPALAHRRPELYRPDAQPPLSPHDAIDTPT